MEPDGYWALSVRQPWAELLVRGVKNVENRTYGTGHRGPLVIQAGQVIDEEALDLAHVRAAVGDLDALRALPRGGLVGMVELVDIVSDSDSIWADWGRKHWIVRPFCRLVPVPYPGRLRLFSVPRNLVQPVHG